MTSPAVTVRPDETTREAIRLLERFSITSVPVVDDRGRPVGIVSEADLLRDAVLPDQRAHVRPVSNGDARPGEPVSDVMTRQVVCVSADDDVSEAVGLMEGTAIKSLPVLLHGRVVGVISRRDVIGSLARQDEDIAREVGELVRRADHDWLISVEDGVVTIEGARGTGDEHLARVLVGSVPGVSAIRLGASSV
jgi:CBS domain-containing protein